MQLPSKEDEILDFLFLKINKQVGNHYDTLLQWLLDMYKAWSWQVKQLKCQKVSQNKTHAQHKSSWIPWSYTRNYIFNLYFLNAWK